MADTKTSALTNIAGGTLADGDEFPVADASDLTVTYAATAANIKTYVNTANVFAAGTASANTWPKFTAGTLLTTPEDGAVEMDADCIYATTDAGNRGYIPVVHIIRADAVRTYTSNTSAQSVFDVPTNGTLTLETGTYLFDGMLLWTAMEAAGTSNRNLNMLGAGTATIGSWLWTTMGIDNAASTSLSDLDAPFHVTNVTAASLATGVAAATLRCFVRGTFEVTAAGTIIPSTTMVVAAASTLSVGSFLRFERIGSTSVTSVGQWT
jgi:hypothetical protein